MEQFTTELVSICIPTYNSARYIKSTIQSVLNQTYSTLEIIICDDNSSDNTLEIVKSLNDSRITIHVSPQNHGITANWNASVEKCSGMYVKLLCADDILKPDCIEKQIAVFHADILKSISLVVCSSTVIDYKDTVLFNRKRILPSGLQNSKKAISKSIFFGTNIIGEPMVGLFRRSDFGVECVFDGLNPYLIDLDFWVKLLQKGPLYFIPEHLASFRISSESISSSLNIKQYLLFCSYSITLYKQKQIPLVSLLFGIFNSFFIAIIRNLIFLKGRLHSKYISKQTN